MRQHTLIIASVLSMWVAAPAVAQNSETESRLTSVQHTQHIHALGKRPYQAVLVQADTAEQAWVGATLRVQAQDVHQAQKLHQLSKRGF